MGLTERFFGNVDTGDVDPEDIPTDIRKPAFDGFIGEGSLTDYPQDVIFHEPDETDDFRVTGWPKTLHDTVYEGTIFGGSQPEGYEDTVDVPGPGLFGDLDEGGANNPNDPRNNDIPFLGTIWNWILRNPVKTGIAVVSVWLFSVFGPVVADIADAIGE